MSNDGRLQTCKGRRRESCATQHWIMDAPTNRHAETSARWRRDPEGSGGALRAKRVHA